VILLLFGLLLGLLWECWKLLSPHIPTDIGTGFLVFAAALVIVLAALGVIGARFIRRIIHWVESQRSQSHQPRQQGGQQTTLPQATPTTPQGTPGGSSVSSWILLGVALGVTILVTRGLIVAVLIGTWLLFRHAWFRKAAVGIAIIMILAAFVFGGWDNIITFLRPENLYPDYNPSAVSISRHRYERTENNHERDLDLPLFDVVLMGDLGESRVGEFCKEGDIIPPANWVEWRRYWVSYEPDRHFGILYAGFSESYGIFTANLPPSTDPRFNDKPRDWCLQGGPLGATLRYERLR